MASTIKRRKTSRPASTTTRSFTSIMNETTREMPKYRRTFSRFIHLHWIAALSNLIGATVARPSAILFGAITSFSLTLVAYLLSKNLGYSLSGFEPIGAFLIGWVVGIIFDVISNALKSRS